MNDAHFTRIWEAPTAPDGGGQNRSLSVLQGARTLCWRDWRPDEVPVSYHRMDYILGGEAHFIRESMSFPLLPGHLCIMPTDSVTYRLEHNPDDPLRVLWCHFDLTPDFINPMIDIPVKKTPPFPGIIACWDAVNRLENPWPEMQHVVRLILDVCDRMNLLRYRDSAMEGVRSYILSHLPDNDLTVGALAEAFGYDRAYFTRKFQESFHLPPGEYIRAMRMSLAAGLLRQGQSITRICAETGYTDVKAFSRAFRLYFRIAPSQYAKSHKLQP